MKPSSWAGFITAAAAILASAPARADSYGLPLPRGSKVIEGDRYASGRGLRDTVEFYKKELDKRGIAHRQIGPYRARAVEVTRFVIEGGRVLAVHVYRAGGKTVIFFVKRRP